MTYRHPPCQTWIEGTAQAHGTTVNSDYAGTHATIGTFSTHTRKLLCTGEGGYCLTNDTTLAARLRELRNIGKPAGGTFGHSFGLNYKLNALAAALGRTQLERLGQRLARRRATLQAITARVTDLPGLHPFPIHADSSPNGYATLFTTTGGPARPVAQRMAAAGITSDPLRYHYRPLYHTPALAIYVPDRPCGNAERLADTLLTVPCHEGIGPDDLHRITAALRG